MNPNPLSQTKLALLTSDTTLDESSIRNSGVSVWSAPTPNALFERLQVEPVDVLVVDLDQPNFYCFSVFLSLYSSYGLPIITLSDPDNTINQIMAISSGADRNLPKPLNVHVLLSNVLAINRGRKAIFSSPANEPISENTWLLNTNRWSLTSPNGSTLKLSMREVLLLRTLANKKGEFLKKDELTELVFQSHTFKRKPNMDRLLNQLRAKAAEAFKEEFPLKTAYLIGYAFTSPCKVISN
jgi:two-component system OmpR family response regulator/two-component system response regulator RstA